MQTSVLENTIRNALDPLRGNNSKNYKHPDSQTLANARKRLLYEYPDSETLANSRNRLLEKKIDELDVF